jgi:hypothetical protein
MTKSSELFKELNTLQDAARKIGKEAIIHLDPLSQVEALNTDLRLIYIDEGMAVFWSKELERPAFLIGEGECDDSDSDECSIELSFNQFSGDILPLLKESRNTIKLLAQLKDVEKLREYIEVLDKSVNTESAYYQARSRESDLETYHRLREKYERG